MHIHVEGQDFVLNPALIDRQKIDGERAAKIVRAHRELSAHVRAMDDLPSNDVALVDKASELTILEYALQDLWGFERDPAFHIHWTRPAACRCDKLLNTGALFGRPVRVVSIECPLHVEPGTVGMQTFLDDGKRWHELPQELSGSPAR
jgi:hypothetical protein